MDKRLTGDMKQEFGMNICGDKKWYVYGAGSYGKRLFKQLVNSGFEVKAIIDKNAQNIGIIKEDNIIIPCITVDEVPEKRDEAIILISNRQFLEMSIELKKRGFTNFYRLTDLVNVIIHILFIIMVLPTPI